jgi:membrane protease YdiL (CAAX protease family)
VAANPAIRLALTLALFYLGWAKFLAAGTDVYLIDYAQRAAIIAVAWGAMAGGLRAPLPPITDRVWLLAAVGAAAIIAADTATDGQSWRAAFDTLLYKDVSFPPLDNPAWEAFDLTFGLLLVAVSEELVFRRLWLSWWAKKGGSLAGLYWGSAVVFGLLHLPQGLADTAIAVVWGLLLMHLYRRSGSLAMVVLVHYAVDLWYFT